MRLVIWGGRTGLQSHRHIHRAFFEAGVKMGIDSVWFSDEPGILLQEDDVVIAADIWSRFLPYHEDVDYVLHNFNADHKVIQQAAEEQILRLQVWTTDAFGETWDEYRQYDKGGRILFQPWGSDLFAEEFMDPVYNPDSKTVVFVGAVWSDMNTGIELGNKEAIGQLEEACKERGLQLNTHTQVSDTEMIALTRSARLAPTVVGNWQCDHGYIPCRAFKHASYGVPVFSNSNYVDALFEDTGPASIPDMLDYALSLGIEDYNELAFEHQATTANYTYRESLESIFRALDEGRSAPEGGPFSDWRDCAPIASNTLRHHVEELRRVLINDREVMMRAAKRLEKSEGAVSVVATTARALRASVSFVPVERQLGIVNDLERALDFLRNSEEPPGPEEQELRDASARIKDILK